MVSTPEPARVLLAGDDTARLDACEAILGPAGHDLVRSVSGADAVEKLTESQFDVVVLASGSRTAAETAELIRTSAGGLSTPILFVAPSDPAFLETLAGRSSGAMDRVAEPLVPGLVRARVSALAELGSLRRRLDRANAELEDAERRIQSATAGRTRLEEALSAANGNKDEFLVMLAHDLRNPLSPIVTVVEILRGKRSDDPEIRWCHDVLVRQSQHLSRLVEDLLEISRITQGQVRMERTRIEASAVVDAATLMNRALLDTRRRAVTVQHPARPIRLDGDLRRLARALASAIDHAVRHIPDEAELLVTMHETRDAQGAPEVTLLVTGTVAGVPMETVPRALTGGFRAADEPSASQSCPSHELVLAARLVELHGGSMTVRESERGRGGEFVIRLPLAADDEAPEAPPASTRFDAHGETPQRVLVADDNEDAARSLAVLLQTSGNVVEVAYDGSAAVIAADAFRPDVMLLDLSMPKLDGYGAARWIRAQPWARNVLLVALTGWGRDEVRQNVRDAGFDAHLVKPVDLAALNALFAQFPATERSGLVAAQ